MGKQKLSLWIVSLCIAIVSHSFFIVEWFDGKFMTGPGDGFSQMLPFKQLLYEQYIQGNFFYADRFGMGGGTYSQLGYYFSTSLFFIVSVILTFVLELTGLIDEADVFYWANLIIPISVVRVTLIIVVTTSYFKYMKINFRSAFVGGVLYGTSIIYFRHVTYWEFFADAMLWLPILLFGVEKIIREKKSGWFVFAITLCLVNNFYFAYINLLLAAIYIVFRWIFKLNNDETKIIIQIKQYIVGGLLAFGVSAVSFIPAVYGYLNNHRIAYEADIPLFMPIDNPLLDGRIIVISTFAVICLWVGHFYRKKVFVFYASLMLLSFILHLSPLIGSMFNGFSAPQYRWEYFLALVCAGVVAVGLQEIPFVPRKSLLIAVIGTAIIYSISYFLDPMLTFTDWQSAYLIYAALATMVIVSLKFKRQQMQILTVFLIMVSLYTSNFYQFIKLSKAGDVQLSTTEWMQSDAYMGADQMELLQRIRESEADGFYRIDWMTPTRNNTPIVQQFNGFSVYSSILNKHLLYFYLYDMEIDTGRESVSRYGTVGNRANLASLLAGKYYIAKNNEQNIPFGFQKKYTVGAYSAYENMNMLPFARTTNKVYTEEALVHAPPITRERAMIDGIILKNHHEASAIPDVSKDLISQVSIKEVGAHYKDGVLKVTEQSGGIDLVLKDGHTEGLADYYVAFSLTRLEENKQFTLAVNEYKTLRKKNKSIYKTGVDALTLRVSAASEIAIRLPKGTYKLVDLQLYTEDYNLLKAYSQSQDEIPYKWNKNILEASYDNTTGECFIAFPIPFEKGWKAYVNGQEQDVHQANYAFIGLTLQDGENEIKLVYHPPYFIISLLLTLLSIMIALFMYRRK